MRTNTPQVPPLCGSMWWESEPDGCELRTTNFNQWTLADHSETSLPQIFPSGGQNGRRSKSLRRDQTAPISAGILLAFGYNDTANRPGRVASRVWKFFLEHLTPWKPRSDWRVCWKINGHNLWPYGHVLTRPASKSAVHERTHTFLFVTETWHEKKKCKKTRYDARGNTL